MAKSFDSYSMRLALILYAVLMAVTLPVIILYIYLRSRKDPRYRLHLRERFGFYKATVPDAIWLHAVSLGEMNAAVPLIRRFLDDGETVVTTHFTPAGRAAAQKLFAAECASGQLVPVYVPLEYDWVFRRFFKAFSPKFGLVMEIEMWPRMIASARRHKVPLFMCNGHYPAKSFERDKRKFGLRGRLATGFAGLLIKSEPDAERFRWFGAANVVMTGELRFDRALPKPMLAAAAKIRAQHLKGRQVITLASVVIGEDEKYIEAITKMRSRYKTPGRPPPLFVYVPRAPERFCVARKMLEQAGLKVMARSQCMDADFGFDGKRDLAQVDVLTGDSLGEMYFYLALADIVVVGGGFTPTGAHNVIEPLALKKPVFVGPYTWTIEFPALEAIEAGVLTQCQSIDSLVDEIHQRLENETTMARDQQAANAFYQLHSGAVDRMIKAIDRVISGSA
ncbi:MAG: 3-deoxy-D-manno-octulosonic acid transferase [Rhodobacteraceae bacterium]|nr:3-deoxy-D-manno-octulosonic acid transferase [Paracoccaceae bacterium]